MSNDARDAKLEGAWLLHAWHLKVGSTIATDGNHSIFFPFYHKKCQLVYI